MMEYDIHTVLDLVTLAATGWVIYAMLGPVHSSWQSDKDTLHELYVVRSLFWNIRNVFQASSTSPGNGTCADDVGVFRAL